MREENRELRKPEKKSACCASGAAVCKIKSIITVDERGQMVLPKELRDAANIKAGDKFVLVTWESPSEVCCISLIRSEHLMERVAENIGPFTEDK